MQFVLAVRLFDGSLLNVAAELVEVSVVGIEVFEHYSELESENEFRVEVGTNRIETELLGASLVVGTVLDRVDYEGYFETF